MLNGKHKKENEKKNVRSLLLRTISSQIISFCFGDKKIINVVEGETKSRGRERERIKRKSFV